MEETKKNYYQRNKEKLKKKYQERKENNKKTYIEPIKKIVDVIEVKFTF